MNKNHRQSLNKQKGVVIVVALFIVALVATMAYVMIARFERDTRRTALILHDAQAELYAQGSVMWAIDVLKNNWQNKKPEQLIDVLPLTSPVNKVNGYRIESRIDDLQGRFNINNLQNNDPKSNVIFDFVKLLQAVDPKLPAEVTQEIAMAVSDWVNPNNVRNPFSEYYAQLPEPYRAAHRMMISISELRLVKGMTPALFNALQNYLVALPNSNTLINIETASAPVFATLSDTMTVEVGKTLENLRAQKAFQTPEQFLALGVVKNHNPSAMQPKITTASNFFLVTTTISIEKQQIVLYTLLERSNDNKATINILWQSKGSW